MFNQLRTLVTYLNAKRQSEEGASAVEYGLLVAAIAAAIVAIVFFLGDVVLEAFTDTCTAISAEETIEANCA